MKMSWFVLFTSLAVAIAETVTAALPGHTLFTIIIGVALGIAAGTAAAIVSEKEESR